MKKKKYGLMILLALFCCILFSASAQAAGAKNKYPVDTAGLKSMAECMTLTGQK